MHPRIIAIPLTRPPPIRPALLVGKTISSSSTKLNSLIYYQFQFTNGQKPPSTPSQKDATRTSSSWLPWSTEGGFVNWASHKAADVWAGFGRAQGGWRLKLHQAGGRLVDRLEFEELALKSIDPSLGPSIMHPRRRRSLLLTEKDEKKDYQIPLLYPPSIISSSTILSELDKYAQHRIPRHKRGFYLWMLVAPFMAPFMLIPVIPNIPFFFCAWRSWSHYRAYRASEYLQSLIQHDMIKPEANQALDQVYRSHPIAAPSSSPNESSSTPSRAPFDRTTTTGAARNKHDLLLTRDAVPTVLEAMNIEPKSTAAGDLYRAVEQAKSRVEKDTI